MNKKGFSLTEIIVTSLIVGFVLSGTTFLMVRASEFNTRIFFEENTQDILSNLIFTINRDIRNGSEVILKDDDWSDSSSEFTKRIEIKTPLSSDGVRYEIDSSDSSLYRYSKTLFTWNDRQKLNLQPFTFDLDSSGFEYDAGHKRCYVKLMIKRSKGGVRKESFMKSYVITRN
ncbi:MAG: prepilin-type N-terminal cleavage/methylation domain-containing protein [Candidatus Delongbacteria bacterium]|nr:prepilin-type N-terminal cleavage/methylation domain-containing protein [Candidatus Delongbacteria bacterium]MBN2834371.1 prepilin-type N-terminal cleavage/methylation domain-containing protein [Candidatus Delongbacteria bacterium]